MVENEGKPQYEPVSAQPVKRFFVDMLTRDIQIEDAILDLLDNCVDGILRNQSPSEKSETPFAGFEAKITVTKESFMIQDNCGGIPWSEHNRAFRMGRPPATEPTPPGQPAQTVGVYGIGMKRAIFKIGREAYIQTQSGTANYEVTISQEWLNAEGIWDLDVVPDKKRLDKDGTEILILSLNEDVQEKFAFPSFKDDLVKKIASHYAVIIDKGFSVQVNEELVQANPIVVRYALETNTLAEIRPYMYKGAFDGVNVFLAVGLRQPIPGFDKITDELEGPQFSSEYAGWTIICNDRVVLYCDRSELTGWGLFGVPRYHTQFIAISGIVEFKGDPAKLPTTTTKRGLKFESSLYQHVLERMRDGVKLFTDFTNKWKSMESEADRLVSAAPSMSFSQVKKASEVLDFKAVAKNSPGLQYKPHLPKPEDTNPDVRLSFMRPKEEVMRLAEELLPNIEDIKDKDIPRLVGIESFKFTYKNLIEK